MKATIQFVLIAVLLVAVVVIAKVGGGKVAGPPTDNLEKVRTQVHRIADELDKNTTETGVYVKIEQDELNEIDPWNSKIQIDYSQGGVSEMIVVRSAGPDRAFHTQDDITAQVMSMNMKGIGEGIKKNAEETSSNASKGAVKGAVEGVKETIKDALPFRKKSKSDSDT